MVEVHLKHVLRQFGGKQLEIWESGLQFWMRKGRAFEMEAVLFGIIVSCHLLFRDGSV